jgi:hypothetical protein
MFRLGDQGVPSPAIEVGGPGGARECCRELYGPFIAAKLRPERVYALMRIGSVDFAYSGGDRFLRALGQTWAAGFSPQPLPSALGRDLPSVTRRLWGVDREFVDAAAAGLAPRL